MALVTALMGLTAGSASAAELVVRDFSAGLELLPTSFTYRLTDPTGTRSGSDAFTSGYGARIGTLWSIARTGDTGGFLLGGDLTYGTYSYASGSAMTTFGGRLDGGYAYALTDHWTLQGVIDAGVGEASLSLQGSSAFTHYTANGLYWSYAARLGVSYTCTDHLLLDLDAGYRATTDSLSAGSTKLNLTGNGICASLGIRWRFITAPTPLE